MRRWTFRAAALALALLPCAALAQVEEDAGELVAYAYNLQHRGAAEALDLVLPLLSSRGAVELQPGGNALVVRDTAKVLQRIRPRLRSSTMPSNRCGSGCRSFEPNAAASPRGLDPTCPSVC